LSTQQVADATEAFDLFDADGSGGIDFKELKTALSSVGCTPTDSEVDIMMRDADKDRNGQLELNEFLSLVASQIAVRNVPFDPDQEVEFSDIYAPDDYARGCECTMLGCKCKKTIEAAQDDDEGSTVAQRRRTLRNERSRATSRARDGTVHADAGRHEETLNPLARSRSGAVPTVAQARQGAANPWVETFSEQHSRAYWINTQTGQRTWTNPAQALHAGSVTALPYSEDALLEETEV
jgi:hypothetical protein